MCCEVFVCCEVPGCPECTFSNDGFYYTGNYNITRDMAVINQCTCTGWHEPCRVKPWQTVRDGTPSAKAVNWTCFESYGECILSAVDPGPVSAWCVSLCLAGDCAAPVVRCTWIGNHQMPIHGKALNKQWKNLGAKQKHHFFADIAWDFFSKFHIEPGSEKERRMVVRSQMK